VKTRPAIPRSLAFLALMTLLTGVLYPAAVTVAAGLAFPRAARGSLLDFGGEVRGSSLLAQEFASPRFFEARPSATGYAYVSSGASNLGPTSGALAEAVAARREAWERGFGSAPPEEMLYASASGVDPDIGLEAALAQVDSVARARGLGTDARESLADFVRDSAEASETLLGPPRMNVVSLNAALETLPRFRSEGAK
jgi:potassium-transporting ATPase KdpC subunit